MTAAFQIGDRVSVTRAVMGPCGASMTPGSVGVIDQDFVDGKHQIFVEFGDEILAKAGIPTRWLVELDALEPAEPLLPGDTIVTKVNVGVGDLGRSVIPSGSRGVVDHVDLHHVTVTFAQGLVPPDISHTHSLSRSVVERDATLPFPVRRPLTLLAGDEVLVPLGISGVCEPFDRGIVVRLSDESLGVRFASETTATSISERHLDRLHPIEPTNLEINILMCATDSKWTFLSLMRMLSEPSPANVTTAIKKLVDRGWLALPAMTARDDWMFTTTEVGEVATRVYSGCATIPNLLRPSSDDSFGEQAMDDGVIRVDGRRGWSAVADRPLYALRAMKAGGGTMVVPSPPFTDEDLLTINAALGWRTGKPWSCSLGTPDLAGRADMSVTVLAPPISDAPAAAAVSYNKPPIGTVRTTPEADGGVSFSGVCDPASIIGSPTPGDLEDVKRVAADLRSMGMRLAASSKFDGSQREQMRAARALTAASDRLEAAARPQREWRARPFFAWFDAWVGLYYDRDGQAVYVMPIPFFGIVIEWGPR